MTPLDHSQCMYEALVDAGNADCRLEVLDVVGHFFEKMYAGYEFDRVATRPVRSEAETQVMR